MNKALPVFFISAFLLFSNARAQLISYTLLNEYSIEDIQQVATDFSVPGGLITYNYAVNSYKVLYKTIHPNGDTIQASGVFIVPQGTTCALPTASYQHGTTSAKENVPSRQNAEYFIGLLYATNGYFLALPDYIGLGDSPGLHPYIHSDSEAQCVVDLLRAGKEIALAEGENQSDDVFLHGYSQGGHATMAAFKAIQELYSDEFNVAASNPMAGPYDLTGVQADVLTDTVPYVIPAYMPYIILAYMEVYDYIDFTLSEIFVSPYDTLLPVLFDGTKDLTEISVQLPSIPSDMLRTDFQDDYNNDMDHPFRRALADNDLIDWTPAAPLRLTHCMGDDQVSFQNSVNAYDSFKSKGVEDIELLDLGNSNHVDCARLALISGVFFYSNYYEADNGLSLANSTVTGASGDNVPDGSISVEISGGSGMLDYLWTTGDTTSQVGGLTSGFYGLTVTDAAGCEIDFSFFVDIMTNTTTPELAGVKVYPNPTAVRLMVDMTEVTGAYQLRLMDLQGRVVLERFRELGEQLVELEVAELASGVYYLELTGAVGKEVRKVFVE